MKNYKVRMQPDDRRALCRAEAEWDEDSSGFAVTFTCPDDSKPRQPPLKDQIERTLGVRLSGYRLMIGEVELVLDVDGQLRHVELRTNPQEWERRALAPLPIQCDFARLDFIVEYDTNRLAVVESSLLVIWDVQRRHLAVTLCDDLVGGRWWRIAQHVGVCVDKNQRLCEIRFEALHGLADRIG